FAALIGEYFRQALHQFGHKGVRLFDGLSRLVHEAGLYIRPARPESLRFVAREERGGTLLGLVGVAGRHCCRAIVWRHGWLRCLRDTLCPILLIYVALLGSRSHICGAQAFLVAWLVKRLVRRLVGRHIIAHIRLIWFVHRIASLCSYSC